VKQKNGKPNHPQTQESRKALADPQEMARRPAPSAHQPHPDAAALASLLDTPRARLRGQLAELLVTAQPRFPPRPAKTAVTRKRQRNGYVHRRASPCIAAPSPQRLPDDRIAPSVA
jgi:hypothetical protein